MNLHTRIEFAHPNGETPVEANCDTEVSTERAEALLRVAKGKPFNFILTVKAPEEGRPDAGPARMRIETVDSPDTTEVGSDALYDNDPPDRLRDVFTLTVVPLALVMGRPWVGHRLMGVLPTDGRPARLG